MLLIDPSVTPPLSEALVIGDIAMVDMNGCNAHDIIECFESSDDDDCADALACDDMGARKIVEWYAHADGVVSTSASVVSEVDVESLIHVLDDM